MKAVDWLERPIRRRRGGTGGGQLAKHTIHMHFAWRHNDGTVRLRMYTHAHADTHTLAHIHVEALKTDE